MDALVGLTLFLNVEFEKWRFVSMPVEMDPMNRGKISVHPSY